MRLRILAAPISLALIASAAAQQTPAPPKKTSDAAALEEAIRAVDRATEKPGTTTKPAAPGDTPSPETPPANRAPAQPKPKPPDSPKTPKPKSPPATQTQITGLEDAELDNARNIITFRKNVVVDRPDLKIWCDRLEIALNRGPAKPAKDKPAKPAKPEEGEKDAFGAESIKTATATAANGGRVVIWRKTESGDVVAVGRQAVYMAADGTFTITGLPEVLRDMRMHFHSPGDADKLVMFKNGNARGGKKQDVNLSEVRAKEIRQRLFSHVPGKRPAEAAPASDAPAAPPSGNPELPPPPKPEAGN